MSRFHWWKELFFLTMAGALLFSFFSLVSFDAADLPEWQSPPNPAVENWCGPAGAKLAASLFQWFGIGTCFGLILLTAWAFRLLRPEPVEDPWFRAIGSIVLSLIMCGALGLLPGPSQSSRMPGYGGIAGVALSDFLHAYFGLGGSLLIIAVLLLLSFLLTTHLPFSDAMILARQGIQRFHRTGPPKAERPESRLATGLRAFQPVSAPSSQRAGSPALPADSPAEEKRVRPESPVPPAGDSVEPHAVEQSAPPLEAAAVAVPSLPKDAPIIDGEPLSEEELEEMEAEDDLPAAPPAARASTKEAPSASASLGSSPAVAPVSREEKTPVAAEARDLPVAPPESVTRENPPRLNLESLGIPEVSGQESETTVGWHTQAEESTESQETEEKQAQPPVREQTTAERATRPLVEPSPSHSEHPAGTAEIDEDKTQPPELFIGGDEAGHQDQDGDAEPEAANTRESTAPDSNAAAPSEPQAREAAFDASGPVNAPEDVRLQEEESPAPTYESSFTSGSGDPGEGPEQPTEASAGPNIRNKIESLRHPGGAPPPASGRGQVQPKKGKYTLPPLDLLDRPVLPKGRELESRQKVHQLENALQNFNVGAEVVDLQRGPTVTMFEIGLLPGVKVSKVVNLADDLAIAMRAQSVRIVTHIPGKSTVGIEIPNDVKEIVRLRELMECKEAEEGDWVLPLFLGKNVAGSPIIADLTQMPHLLIAGATGSGKSVAINSLIAGILMTQTPDDVRLILVDPKMVELSGFEDIPHLLSPVVTDMKKAPGVLEWAVKKMDERYDLLASVGVRHIHQFNQLGEEKIRKRLAHRGWEEENFPFHLPYIVVVVDEYADLMMVSPKELEKSITRLAQKSRAVGIHVVLATQRPSVDVITGLIKSNMTARVAFSVTSKVDSRTILDLNGAEKLVGRGDMLFLPPGKSDLVRCQGTYVGDEELRRIVNFLRAQDNPEYEADLEEIDDLDHEAEDFGQRDSLYDQAVRIVLQTRRGSVSLLQRKLEIGYTRAARLMDFMAKDSIVGGYKGSKAREVLMTLQEWEASRGMLRSDSVPDSPDLEGPGSGK